MKHAVVDLFDFFVFCMNMPTFGFFPGVSCAVYIYPGVM